MFCRCWEEYQDDLRYFANVWKSYLELREILQVENESEDESEDEDDDLQVEIQDEQNLQPKFPGEVLQKIL